ncbi:MAG: hypothetical protein ACKOET_13595, partial [Verrucomicrobiota bacterium]
VITLAATFLGGLASRLRFASQLGVASPDQQAVVEISTDGGSRWRPVWSRPGDGVPGETTFTLQDVPLAGVDGQPFQLRFRYAPGASYYPQTDPGVGWYFDDVSLSGVSQLQETTLGLQSAAGRVEMAFPGVGDWVLRVRPRVEGRPLPYGPLLLATAAPHTGTPPVVRIRRTTLDPDGRLRLVFGLDSGQASLFRLDAAPTLGGPWTERPLASPTLVAGEGTFLVPMEAAAGLFRVRVP